MRSLGERDHIHHLPHRRLKLRKRTRRWPKLLNARNRKQRQRIVERSVRRNPRNSQRRRSRSPQNRAHNRVAPTRIANRKVIQQPRRKSMRLIEHRLLAQHIRQPRYIARPQNRPANQPTAIRQRRNRLFHLVVVRVPSKSTIASPIHSIHANIELVLMVRVIRRPRSSCSPHP